MKAPHALRALRRVWSVPFGAFGAFGVSMALSAACATSVDDRADNPGLFAATDDAGVEGSDAASSPPKRDAGKDAGHTVDATTAEDAGTPTPPPTEDAGTTTPPPVTLDASTDDATTPPPPVGDVCAASNGLYTIEYLALLSGDGGALKPCPCGVGDCCYTPPGGFIPPVCLKK